MLMVVILVNQMLLKVASNTITSNPKYFVIQYMMLLLHLYFKSSIFLMLENTE